MDEVDCCARCPCCKKAYLRPSYAAIAQCSKTGKLLAYLDRSDGYEALRQVDPSCPLWIPEEEDDEDREEEVI